MDSEYVFISYARADRAFVDRLSAELRRAGVNTWVDTQDIVAGANWDQEIERGLFRADVLLHVASKNSADSQWLAAELNGFLASKGRAIPLIIDDAGPAALPAALRTVQWVDFRGDFQKALGQLLQGIVGLRGASPLPPAKEKSKGYAFISFATEDGAFVANLKLFLAERGYAHWDFHTSKRNYQIDYSLELEERIRNAEATLAVISPAWKRSSTALQELHFSREVGTPVFLLRLIDPGPTLVLSGKTFIDFSASLDQGFHRLADEMADVGL